MRSRVTQEVEAIGMFLSSPPHSVSAYLSFIHTVQKMTETKSMSGLLSILGSRIMVRLSPWGKIVRRDNYNSLHECGYVLRSKSWCNFLNAI